MKWIQNDSKIVGDGRDIIYAREKYFLTHINPNGIAYSEDLKNWTEITLDNNKIGSTENLAYGNSKFIVTGNAGNTPDTYIYVSDDGFTWRLKKLDTGESFSMHSNSCRFINNRFVFMIGYYTHNSSGVRLSTTIIIYETKDGENIKKHTYTHQGSKNISIMDISYNNNLYCMVGESGCIFTSPDLDNWTEQKSPVSSRLVGIIFGRNKFIVTGANGVILSSEDGRKWTQQITNNSSYLIRARYGNGLYIAVGYNGTILTSINGMDWIEENDPFVKGTIYGVVFSNNRYVVTANRYVNTNAIPILYSEISRDVNIAEDSSLYIFDKNLNFVGTIDEFISLRWRRKYYEAGEFDLVVAPFENNIEYLKKDNIIIRNNYTEAAIIDTLEFIDDGNNVEIKASGNFLSYLMKRRIIKNKINYSGNIIDGQKQLLRQMTPLSNDFEIEPTELDSDIIQFQCTYQNVYDYECKLSKISNVGFRIVPNIDHKVYRFENYKGLDRTKNQSRNEKYCFSDLNYNLEKSNVIDTLINKCNYVLIGGTGEDSNRIMAEIKSDESSGFDLFECFVDAKSESNKDLSSSDYKNVLLTKGKEKIQDETITMNATAYSDDYKKKWDLGDIVDVLINAWNVSEPKRITEVEETIENGTKSIYPTFGSPLAEKIELS